MRPKKYPLERVLTVVACVGAIIVPFGSLLNFGRGHLTVPGLGIKVQGSVLLVIGCVLMLVPLILDSRLSQVKTREEVIRESLGPEEMGSS